MAEEKEESYEDLLEFFDKEKDLSSSVDINLNSKLQRNEEEINVSLESSQVLTDIDNLLNESSNGKDVSDATGKETKQVGEEKVAGASEATESPKARNGVAGPSGVKRKAEEDLEDLLAVDSSDKTSKLDEAATEDHQDEREELDDRLLDGEDDDDDGFLDSLTFEQMAALLDQTEEESQEGTEADGTESPQITRSQISQRLRELKKKYKDVLKQVCNMYGMKWVISGIDPMVHQDPDDKTKILGIEELQEYVDNQHPMWYYDKEFVKNQMLCGPSPALSNYVHTRWGKQNINPRSSLVVVEGFKEEEKKEDLAATNSYQNLQVKTEDGPEIDLHKRAIKAIMEMDIEAISQEVLEKEKERKKLYEQKVHPLYTNTNDVPPFYNENNLNNTLNSENNVMMIKAKAMEKGWSAIKTDEVIAGTEEAVVMASLYTDGDTGLSEEQLDIILDMEEAHDKILQMSVQQKVQDANQNKMIMKEFRDPEFLENA